MTTPLLDVNGAARYFGVSRTMIYYLVKTGSLNPVKVRSRLRFRLEDLDAYLENGAKK